LATALTFQQELRPLEELAQDPFPFLSNPL
jgi:hypothetical protein